MITVTATVDVNRPASEVFAFLADFANNPRWQGGMRSAHWTSEPPHGVGSTYEQVASFLGKEVRSSFEVEEFAPGASVTIRSTSGSFPIRVTRTVEPLGEARSRVTAHVAGDPSGFYRVAAPLLGWMVRRSVRRDYRRLRELLERDG